MAAGWTFLTNHAHVLLAVARDPDSRVGDIAAQVGITGRAALLILKDLERAGYLHRRRQGRRTHYELVRHRPFRHPSVATHEIDELLALLVPPGAAPVDADRGGDPRAPGTS